MSRNVYLKLKPVARAREEFLAAFDWPTLAGTEEIDAAAALGRVTARPAFARYSSPAYHCAAMDGYAVAAHQTFGASEERPLYLEPESTAWPVNTGHPLPQGTDAVVMIEHVHQDAEGRLELRGPAFPWQHVRKVGEDIVAQEMILPHHHRLTPADVAALLAAGVFRVEVLKRPRVTVIPTGSELIPWQEAAERQPEPGQIIETNSLFLAGLIEQAGAEVSIAERRPDQLGAITEAIGQAQADGAQMVVVNAGASAGSKDFTAAAVGELGEVLVHGIAAMPGKPSILGKVAGRPVVGSPGYPVSAWVCFDQFIAPALALMAGQSPPQRESLEVVPARPLASKLGQEEFLRVHLGRVGEAVVATPLKRGAGTITSLTRADGVLRIPVDSDGVAEGTPIRAELLKPRQAVERTLVIVGSHDISLDILADLMRDRDPLVSVSSSHLGSLAGLMALRAGRCHLGGTHLLDPASGDYNVSYLQRHLQGVPVRLVTLAWRQQGLMVAPGNPKGIKTFADLARPGVTMVNRQAGSGTRVLLDYHLRQEGIDPAGLEGYDNEEFTHMGVAVHVLTGAADVGMGILAAAASLGLEFVPLMQERYDLCIPQAHLDDPRVRLLLEVLADPGFRQAVEDLGGYDVTEMGRVAWEG